MLSRDTLLLTTLLAMVFTCTLAACTTEKDTAAGSDYLTEAEACVECKNILVECSSTSMNESEFVACRDQWLACQVDRKLGPDECGNPRDSEACSMCRTRLTECKAINTESGACDTQFSTCKAFLMTRGDVQEQCTEEEQPNPQVTCGVCQKDFATCTSDASGANTIGACGTKFETCKNSNQLNDGSCQTPWGEQGCTLCQAVYEDCYAAGGDSCRLDFDACSGAISGDFACSLSTDEEGGQGGGGSEPGGEGGAGAGGGDTSGGGTCAHEECVEGDALDATCSTCASEVCAEDAYCCSDSWDSFCLDIAAGKASCGCS